MGHIAHLRKQFKSIIIKSINYFIIMLIKRRKKPLLTLWQFIGFSFEQTWIPFIQECFVPSWLKLAQWFWRRGLNEISSMYFRYFIMISPWKGWDPSFEQTWIPFTQGCFVPSLVEFGKRRFLNFINLFSLFLIMSPWKRTGPFFWTKLESPSPKDALCQVWLTLTLWFWRRRWKCDKFTPTTTTTDNGQILIGKAH